ncbi:MAG TPA: hypothetical protein VK646_03000 [Actinomycetota bacterium]|nr:hypothetical protein [Actinomycetota bacterium]
MKRVLFAIVFVAALTAPGLASASWHQGGTGTAYAGSDDMPAGLQPALSLAGHNVTVSWSAAQFSDGSNITHYQVIRYDDATDTAHAVASGCSGTVSGLSCTENNVASGDWYYTVTPIAASWVGDEGPASNVVSIAAPSFVFTSSTNLSTLPATLNGTISNYLTGETATFRLDDPTSGTLLTGSITPSTVPASGSANVTVTIPNGTANGVHQVYVIGSSGSVANAAIALNVADTTAPVVSAAVIGKTAGGTPGYVKASGTYYIYANANDPGFPTTGVSQVRANVANITTGQTNVLLTAGSYTVGGVTYGYRSSSLTSNAGLTAGSKAFTVWAIDVAGNSSSGSPFNGTVTADITKPTATNISFTNVGTVGKAETGDKVILTYSETMEPISIISGWNGSSTTVTVRLTNNGGGDRVQIYNAANTTVLPLGTVRLGRTDYTTATVNFTNSTMSLASGVVTITLGTPSGATATAAGTGTIRWTPVATATDLAGNTASTTAFSKTGTAF